MTLVRKVFSETESVSQKLAKKVGKHRDRAQFKLRSAQQTESATATKRLGFQIKSGA